LRPSARQRTHTRSSNSRSVCLVEHFASRPVPVELPIRFLHPLSIAIVGVGNTAARHFVLGVVAVARSGYRRQVTHKIVDVTRGAGDLILRAHPNAQILLRASVVIRRYNVVLSDSPGSRTGRQAVVDKAFAPAMRRARGKGRSRLRGR